MQYDDFMMARIMALNGYGVGLLLTSLYREH